MDIRELVSQLATWSGFLAGGFALNLLVSAVAMAVGIVIGGVLASLRVYGGAGAARAAAGLTGLAHRLPSFALLFYMAYLLPSQVSIAGATLPIPTWLKAGLALSMIAIEHVSNTLSEALQDRRRGRRQHMAVLLPSWGYRALIIVLVSSTASVIGVSELVSRCNTVIGALDRADLLVWVYLYGMLWFFGFCWPLLLLLRHIEARLERRVWMADAARSGSAVPMLPSRGWFGRPRSATPAPG